MIQEASYFFEFVDILKQYKPKYFLLENVIMNKESNDVISSMLGELYPECVTQTEMFRTGRLEPICINSSLVSAQNRDRNYWTNIPDICQPKDKGILLKDILLSDGLPVNFTERRTEKGKQIRKEYRKQGVDFSPRREKELIPRIDNKSNCITANIGIEHLILKKEFPICLHNIHGGFGEKEHRTFTEKSPTIRTSSGGGHIPSLLLSEQAIEYMNRQVKNGRTHWDFKHHSDTKNDKSQAVVANFFKGVPYNVLKDNNLIRKFHPIECERLQTIPDNYTEGISSTQRYKCIGNGWTVDVISHIFENMEIY